jgi:general secretion pathway protein G
MILHPHRRREQPGRSAFTLLEVLIVVSIIVILASIGGTYAFRAYEDAQISQAQTKAYAIGAAAQRFLVKYERLPNDLAELSHPPTGGTPFQSEEDLRDPWGKQFQYDPNGAHNNGLKPDVYTVTPKGETVGNWKN